MTFPGLRAARPGDAAAIAAFHVRQWRATYRDLAPRAAWDALDEARRLRDWTATLSAPPPAGAFLACDGEAIAGLVSFGAPGHPVFGGRGEVKHLYVDAGWRGRGLGRRLLRRARAALAAAGFSGAGLAVVAGNHPARAFYRAAGGVEAAAFTDPGPLWKSDNILVVWD